MLISAWSSDVLLFRSAKLISRFVKLSIIAAVGGAVWLIKSHPDLFTTAGAAAQRQWADVRSSRETRRTSSATVEMASAEEGESRPSHRPVNSPTVVHNGADGCAITQMVRNDRSEEHTSELQSLMRISYAVFCLKKKKHKKNKDTHAPN